MSLMAELAFASAANKLREALDESTTMLLKIRETNNLKESAVVDYQIACNRRTLKETEGY